MERVGSLKRDKRTGEKMSDSDKSRNRTGSGSSHGSLVGFEAKYPVSSVARSQALAPRYTCTWLGPSLILLMT